MLTPVKMPAPPPAPQPNGVFLPSVVLTTAIVAGKPQTSAAIAYQGAQVANAGSATETWKPLGTQPRQNIPNIAALPADLAAAAPQAAALVEAAQAFGDAVNQARRVITATE